MTFQAYAAAKSASERAEREKTLLQALQQV